MSNIDDTDSLDGCRFDAVFEQRASLDNYYRSLKKLILKYQSPTTGLYPVSTSHDTSGTTITKTDSPDGSVRQTIYCCMSSWALSLAYKKLDNDNGRTQELQQSAVKSMRGILFCYMRQSNRVEQFKKFQNAEDALHSRFNLMTGDELVRNYPHMQMDVIGLYLLTLVQMIASGLKIIYSMDEVNFVQNLVYYVERAYRTPDFGLWERGTKNNNGTRELHSSSVGMVKSGLDAINGFNLFGSQGTAWSVIYVDIDAHNRNRTIFETLLPRESSSKNTDLALLPTLTFPAFAIDNAELRGKTKAKVINKLQGRYGVKRFLRDGYRTVLEEEGREYYRPAEIKLFDRVECEWPLGFLFLILDGLFTGDQQQVNLYHEKLQSLLITDKKGVRLVPEYYYVPQDVVDLERSEPGSQFRLSSHRDSQAVFLWGQALYTIITLIMDGLLATVDMDPIGRSETNKRIVSSSYNHDNCFQQQGPSDLVVQMCIIAESSRLQALLSTYGILSQTPHQVEPMQIWSPSGLVDIYEQLGVNKKLGLSGRPNRPVGALGTSKIYRIEGQTIMCYPLQFELQDFYMGQDILLLVDEIKQTLRFIRDQWNIRKRPTFCCIMREDSFKNSSSLTHILDLLSSFKHGHCDGVPVRLERLQTMLNSAAIEHLDFFRYGSATQRRDLITDDKRFSEKVGSKLLSRELRSASGSISGPQSDDDTSSVPNDDQDWCHKSTPDILRFLKQIPSFNSQAELLAILLEREGGQFIIDGGTVEDTLDRLLRKSATQRKWSVVRYCASKLKKIVDSLAPCVSTLLVRGKMLTIGVFGHEEVLLENPRTPTEIKDILYRVCSPYDVRAPVMQQEMIINISKLIQASPELFNGILKIRVGWVMKAMNNELNISSNNKETLHSLSPSELKNLLKEVVSSHLRSDNSKNERNWLQRRKHEGALNRVPQHFYDHVWEVLARCPYGLRVCNHHLPQQPIVSDMTKYDFTFSLRVEDMLGTISEPVYREVVVELLVVLYEVLTRNRELSFSGTANLDDLISQSHNLWVKDNVEQREDMESSLEHFFNIPPCVKNGTASYMVRSVMQTLLQNELTMEQQRGCCLQ